MVSINVDNEPANIKVITFRLFFSFEDFSSSLDTAIQRTMETIATTAVDKLYTLLIFNLCEF